MAEQTEITFPTEPFMEAISSRFGLDRKTISDISVESSGNQPVQIHYEGTCFMPFKEFAQLINDILEGGADST